MPVGVGTHEVGPLQDGHGHGHPGHPWASENPVGLGNGTFWTTWHWDPRSGSVARFLHVSLTGQFMLEKRPFSTESEHFLGCFALFLTSDEAGLRQVEKNGV